MIYYMKHLFLTPISYFSLLTCFVLFGCHVKNEENVNQREQLAKIATQNQITEVKVCTVRKDHFEMELVSNGKVEAQKKAILNFKVADIIDSVYVSNGSRVKKGDIILKVDGYKTKQLLEDALVNLKKAELDLLNRLMSEGIKELKDTNRIPTQRLHTIMLQCGYISAQNAYKKALQEYTNIRTVAPFSGIIADLEAKPYNPSSAYEKVCTLINDTKMEMVFNILETEVGHIHKGMEVKVTPYANQAITLSGKIIEVNPRIDENGMVKIKAMVDNSQHHLVDGMNVSIILKRQIENKLIIPRSAVLPRQGKKVVFVHKNGKAIWKYVTTGVENSMEISIESGLKVGEEVIYENNLELSHESEVKIITK